MSKDKFVRLWALCGLLLCVSPALLAQEGSNASEEKQSAERDHPIEREKWFMQGRIAPQGKSPAELRWHAYQQKIQQRAARIVAARRPGASKAAASGLSSTGWTALGPAPLHSDPGTGQDYGFVSGRATAVAIDPGDATGNTVYVGGAYGGLWRTTNGLSGGSGNPGGVTWTPMIDTMGTLAVGAVAIQPSNATGSLSNTILVGTGEANSSADSYYGLGILRSTDHGQTWNLIPADSLGHPFHGLAFSKIAFSTTAPSTVVAATATSSQGVLNGSRTGAEQRGLYVSTNAGLSWTFETSVKDGATSISPLTNSVTSVSFNPAAGKFYAAFRYHGFYSSTDGANWTRLTAQPAAAGAGLNSAGTCPSAVGTTITCPIYRGEIAVVNGRNEMYVWYTDPNDGDQGIWKTTDGGASWIHINDSNITNCGDTFGGCGTAQGGYDLELAAVANGTNTDVYAGARNLYKCTISPSSPTCNGSTEPNFFMNLTHVYGCNAIAKFHPDQHHLDARVVSGKAVMYFANDGGIYRAVDGFTGLQTGVCTGTNQFDSLNGTLGSMTEFVSMSQDAVDPNTILGGTQDNGSPSSSAAQISSQWHSVLGGDGGYNEINPGTTGSTGQWFTSNPPFSNGGIPFNINIYSCSLGSNCLDGNFINTTKNADIGGDVAPFYPFFMLDPQAPGKMLIGTACRLWRGDVSSGVASGFVALTDSFDSAGSVPCTGGEINQVHAADAGGPTDANGSKVVYAVTEGTGPNQGPGGVPTGGEVWVSVNANGGIGTWSNVTSTINPSHYSIGAVAVDSSDVTGATAYVGIQGFHASHVFKTVNAGANWSDFSGTLPDAPVNSLVIDAASGVVYAGTDVGVFSSATTSAAWSEVGPAPISATPGYLPDAPVTKLRLYSHSGTKLLRASTYGRGIWEFQLALGAPDFSVNLPVPSLSTYPNQPVTYNGSLTSINGYSSPVNLSCTGGTPSTCTLGATPVTPIPAGAPFTITAANAAVGDFSFTIHAAGTDTLPQVHDQPATLHVVNFALTTPNPSSITANVPNISTPTVFQVTAAGAFVDAVTLSCSGLPAGATCNFSPSASVQPTSSSPVAVTLTIGTVLSTPVGMSAVTITAHDAANPEPTAKTQVVSLVVTANPDYTVVVSNPTPPKITVQGQQSFDGLLTAYHGYSQPVAITCAAGATPPPATCLVTVSPTTPTSTGANFTVLAADTIANTFNFVIHTTDGTLTHDQPVTLVLDPDFNIVNTTTTQTITAGGTATFTPLSFNPDGSATFPNDIAYTCAGLPSLSTCTFSPSSITGGSGSTPVAVAIHTTAAIASGALPASPWNASGPLFAFLVALPAFGIVSIVSRGNLARRATGAAVVLVFAIVTSFTACGGGAGGGHQGQPGTPPGTYKITLNAKAAAPGIAQQSTTLNLVVQ